MKLIWKILKANISPGQLTGFALANLLGIAILLLSLQFHADLSPVLTGKTALVQEDYLVLSKKPSTIRSFLGNSGGFSAEEIAALESWPEVRDAGSFQASNFDVYASMNISGHHLGTALFFEAVPDRFVDAENFFWKQEEKLEDNVIPIMIPKEYLDLYNFGFSISQGLPQLSENMLKSLVLDIDLHGNGRSMRLKARITGFSNYLNTVLVPENFMDWANEELSAETKDASRILLDVKNPSDAALLEKIGESGYEIAQNKENYGKMTFVLNLVTGTVLFIGLVISLLSFFILTLSIWLLIQKNQEKIQHLELLGYRPAKIALPYSCLIAGIDIITLILAASAAMFLKNAYTVQLQDIVPIQEGSFTIWMAALVVAVLTLLLHLVVLRLTLKKIYRKK